DRADDVVAADLDGPAVSGGDGDSADRLAADVGDRLDLHRRAERGEHVEDPRPRRVEPDPGHRDLRPGNDRGRYQPKRSTRQIARDTQRRSVSDVCRLNDESISRSFYMDT